MNSGGVRMSGPLMGRVATAPISWGICEVPGWGEQLPADRVCDEMAALGFPATELGEHGFLPTDPAEMVAFLNERELAMIGGFNSLVLHKAADAEATMAAATATADLFVSIGATHFVTAAVTDLDWSPRAPLSDTEWDHLSHMLSALDEMLKGKGLRQVLHPHVGTVVETADDVQRVLDTSDVDWCLDTGHLSIGGFDPVAFAESHHDRVGLVHLKDVTNTIADELNAERLSLLEAVQQNLFPPLGSGDIAIDNVIAAMENAGYDDWYVLEQDVALTDGVPPVGEGPALQVAESLAYLESVEAAHFAA